MHRSAPPDGDGRFGWRRDNWLGGTPQRNRWSAQGGLAGWLYDDGVTDLVIVVGAAQLVALALLVKVLRDTRS